MKAATVDEIDELLAGDGPLADEDFAALCRHYEPMLTRYARRQGASDPEGVANQALFDAYRALGRLEHRHEKSFRTYLHRAAYGHIHAERRRPPDLPVEINDDAFAVDDPTIAWIDEDLLREAVESLSPGQREVIEHRYLLDLSGEETAQRLGKDRNAIYQTQHRAIDRLRQRLIAAAIMAVLAVLGGWVWFQRSADQVIIDNSPVDEAPLVDDGSGTERRDGADDAQPDEGEDVSLPGPVGTDNGSIGSIDAVGADVIEPAAEDNPADGRAPTGEADGGEQAATQAQAATTEEPSDPPPVEESEPDQPEPEPEPPAAVRQATTLNACQVHQLSGTVHALRLFNPFSDQARMDSFVAPASVVFLNASGATLHTINTSGPMVDGLVADNHGWLGVGGGTSADPVNVSPPAHWGVLAPSSAIDGWASVAIIDHDGTWLPWAAGLCST